MQGITLVLAVAVLIEGLGTYLKEVKAKPQLLVYIGLGVVLAFVFRAGLFGAMGIEVNQYADLVLSGIVMSRGSNYVYDLVGKMTGDKVEHNVGAESLDEEEIIAE